MKIAVLLSGGVDSSVALQLLKDQGHELTAFYLKIWLEDELSYMGDCPWEADLEYVRAVCKQAGVPLKIVSLQKEYRDSIIAYAIDEIKAGRTPNPDVLCNNRIKFGVFLDHVGHQYDKVATGHYAQTEMADPSIHPPSPVADTRDERKTPFVVSEAPEGRSRIHTNDNVLHRLKKAPDPIKDQTYFLSYLSQDQLKRALFPIGHLAKEQVRELAKKYDLPTQDRKDSQGLCFLGKIKFANFIKHHLGEQQGDMIEFETGKVLGNHPGVWFYTIGQRRGSGLSGGPWYVVTKNHKQNKLFVSRTYYSDDKARNNFVVDKVRWITSTPDKTDLQVKLRHGASAHDCVVTINDDQTVSVKLASRDQGIAPGQFAAFYDGNYCLGSGIITEQ